MLYWKAFFLLLLFFSGKSLCHHATTTTTSESATVAAASNSSTDASENSTTTAAPTTASAGKDPAAATTTTTTTTTTAATVPNVTATTTSTTGAPLPNASTLDGKNITGSTTAATTTRKSMNTTTLPTTTSVTGGGTTDGCVPQLNETCIWGSWGPCSATCDYGVWTRTKVSFLDPNTTCAKPATETDRCFVAPCPIDCVVDANWLCWTPCSAPCGGGFRYRSRQVIVPPLFGGTPCNESDLNEQEACNTSPCAYECQTTGEWSSWSSCSAISGRAIQQRSIAFSDGLLASRTGPNTTCAETEQERSCDISCCSASYDCLQSDWSSWSQCSASCGSGTQFRTRSILIPAMGSGTSCGPTYEVQKCNTLSCTDRSLGMLCSRRRNTFVPFGRCSTDYIYCTPGGQAVFNTCPHGKAFSAIHGFCIRRSLLAECVKYHQAGDCSGRANGLYPLCPCCSQYLLCWEGVSTTRSCRSNEAFETRPFGRCVDRSSSAACRGRWY